MATFFRYIQLAAEFSKEDLLAAIDKQSPRIREVFMNIAQQWYAEGEARGEARGEAKGRAATLLRQLELKFGPVALGVRERVLGATEVELERWTETILSATSLDGVFGA